MAEKIGVWSAAAVGLGAIIGAGIFVLSGTVIALAGVWSLLAFVIVGVLALIIALEIGELGSIMPNTKGATYSYIYGAFGSEMGFISGILMFVSYSTATAVISDGFGAYLSGLLGLGSSSVWVTVFALLLIIALSIVNMFGIRKAVKADATLVAIKILVLIALIGFAAIFALEARGADLGSLAWAPTGPLGGIIASGMIIFFAYSGFQSIASFVSEIRGSGKGAARAIIISVVASIVLYTLVVFSMMLLAPPDSYTVTGNPLSYALTYSKAPGWLLVVIDIGALVATASASLANILRNSRLAYQISEDGLLPKVFEKYDAKKDVAINGIVLSSAISVVMLFTGNLVTLVSISNFGLIFGYLMCSFALIHFRRDRVNGSFRMPYYPYVNIVAIVGLLVFLSSVGSASLGLGLVLIVLLLATYYLLRETGNKPAVKIRIFK